MMRSCSFACWWCFSRTMYNYTESQSSQRRGGQTNMMRKAILINLASLHGSSFLVSPSNANAIQFHNTNINIQSCCNYWWCNFVIIWLCSLFLIFCWIVLFGVMEIGFIIVHDCMTGNWRALRFILISIFLCVYRNFSSKGHTVFFFFLVCCL